jgi:hypothetical protein
MCRLSAATCRRAAHVDFALAALEHSAYSFGRGWSDDMLSTRLVRAGGLRIVCAIALLCLSLAHHSASAASQTPLLTDVSVVLPDGSFGDLCLERGDASGTDHPAGSEEVCFTCCLPTVWLAASAPSMRIEQIGWHRIDRADMQPVVLDRRAVFRRNVPRGPPGLTARS